MRHTDVVTTVDSAPASGLIYCVLPRATVGLIVRDGLIELAPPYLRRLVGADARQTWRELARQAEQLQWLPL